MICQASKVSTRFDEHEVALKRLDAEINAAVKKNGSTKLTELAARSDVPQQIKRKLARMYMA